MDKVDRVDGMDRVDMPLVPRASFLNPSPFALRLLRLVLVLALVPRFFPGVGLN